MTPLPAHTRHLLRVADELGQCFLPLSSYLMTWEAAAGGLPISLCTIRSCPACTNKFPTRVSRKLPCGIFLPRPQWGKKNVAIQNGSSNRWKKIWCDFDRASSLICGNKMPTRCNRGFYCRSYCLLNMFRASPCPSSGAQEYYTLAAACGIFCCKNVKIICKFLWNLCSQS